MCRILQCVKTNILHTEDISGFLYLSFICSFTNIYWTSTMSDIYHLVKMTNCLSFFYEGVEIYKQGRCWFCTQVLWDGKYQGRKTGLGVRIGKTKPEAYPWLQSRRGKTMEDTELSTDSFAGSCSREHCSILGLSFFSCSNLPQSHNCIQFLIIFHSTQDFPLSKKFLTIWPSVLTPKCLRTRSDLKKWPQFPKSNPQRRFVHVC